MKADDRCPACQALSLSLARMHCRPEARSQPCGWLRCDCGATVAPDGRFIPAPATAR